MLNKIIICGRMVNDAELRMTQSGTAVTSFAVAVERDYGEKNNRVADFISVTAWRQSAEFVNNYIHKGDMIAVCGSLQSREYTDKDGIKRRTWEIQAEHCYAVGSRKSESAAPVSADECGMIPDDGDLPF